MSSEHDDLSKLFEQSASTLDPLTHGRLRAIAREIPEQRGTPWRFPGFSWVAGLCALAAVGAVLLVGLRRAPSVESSVAQSAPPRASQTEPVTVVATEASPVGDEVDELASGFDFDDASAPDVLDDLALDPGDLADSDVDVWISAANDTLGG